MSLATYTMQNSQSKVHFSEYLRTENKPVEDEKPTETTKPEPKEAEQFVWEARYLASHRLGERAKTNGYISPVDQQFQVAGVIKLRGFICLKTKAAKKPRNLSRTRADQL